MTRFSHLYLLAITLFLNGCGAIDWVTRQFGDEDNSQPATELVEFEPSINVEEIWSEDIGIGTGKQFYRLQPITTREQVFVADREGEVKALSLVNGDEVWEQDLETLISGGPGVGEGLVLLGSSEGEVIALSQDSGKTLWKSTVTSEILSAPQAAEGVVVARTGDGKVFGIDATNGARIWSYDKQVPLLTLRGTSSPVLAGGFAICGFDNGTLVALELKSGKVVWEMRVAQPHGRSDLERMVDIDSEPIVDGDTLFVVTYQGGLSAISLRTGQPLWNRELSSYTGIATDSTSVYVTDDYSKVWALDRETGEVKWVKKGLKGRALTAPARLDDYVVLGDFEGYIHWLDKTTSKMLARNRVDSSKIIATPLAIDNQLMVYTTSGILAVYQVK